MGNRKNTVDSCKIIDLSKIKNDAGNITVVQNGISTFDVKRIFYIYDIPGGEDRGAHSHKECHQLLVAASGSFMVEVEDGVSKKEFNLNRPYFGLHIPPGIWAAEKEFSSGAICLVLASHQYQEEDYIRDYNEYLKSRNGE